jgi:hypothetical protein
LTLGVQPFRLRQNLRTFFANNFSVVIPLQVFGQVDTEQSLCFDVIQFLATNKIFGVPCAAGVGDIHITLHFFAFNSMPYYFHTTQMHYAGRLAILVRLSHSLFLLRACSHQHIALNLSSLCAARQIGDKHVE